MLNQQPFATFDQQADYAFEKLDTVFQFLNIHHWLDFNSRLKFRIFFNDCPASIREKLCSFDFELFQKTWQRLSEFERQNIVKHFTSEIQNEFMVSHDIFNLYELLLQSPQAFLLEHQVRSFIYDRQAAVTEGTPELRRQVKALLEQKSGWNVELSNQLRLSALQKQRNLIDDYKCAVIDYRDKVKEEFCVGNHLYRRLNGVYSLDNFNDFLQESEYIPEDGFGALFKFTQCFMMMDIGEHLDFPSQELERSFRQFYQALPMNVKKSLHKSNMVKFESYFNMLESDEQRELKELFVGQSSADQMIAFAFICDTVISQLPDIRIDNDEFYTSSSNSYLPGVANHYSPSAQSVGADDDFKDGMRKSQLGFK